MHAGRLNATLTPIVPDFQLGSVMIGAWIGWWLAGWNAFCAFYYFQRFPKDTWSNKGVIIMLVLLEMFYTACVSSEDYEWAVQNFGNYNAMAFFTRGHVAAGMLGAVVTLLVQCKYAERALVVSKLGNANAASHGGRWWAPVIIVALALVSFGFGLTFSILLVGWDGSQVILGERYTYGTLTWWATGAATDVTITLVFTFFLVQARTDYADTNHLLTRLLLFTFQTNSLTTITAVLLIALWGKVQLGTEVLLYDLMTHFYVLSMMITLTFSRPPRWSGDGHSSAGHHHVTDFQMASQNLKKSNQRYGPGLVSNTQSFAHEEAGLRPPHNGINITTVTYTEDGSDFTEKSGHPYTGNVAHGVPAVAKFDYGDNREYQ